MQRLILSLLVCLNSCSIFAQQKYFQQRVNTKIQVTLDDVNHMLNGNVELFYFNNSPDVLDKIALHLWPNAYKDNSTAFAKQQLQMRSLKFQDATPEQRGFIDQLQIKVNKIDAKLIYDSKHPDIAWIQLNEALKPGGSIVITTPFRVKIPHTWSRLGHVGQSYQITQWYPKVAVYDHKGWHAMPYLDIGEFYSEFGNYEISITLPKNYLVAATGSLQESEEIEWLETMIEKTNKTIAGELAFPTLPILSDSIFKTITYKAKEVHDFAWFADKNFYVQKDSVITQKGKKIDTWAFFTLLDFEFWKKAASYVSRAVLSYSDWVGEYPWPHATAVESALAAGGGMEYPMITVIGDVNSDYSLDNVITHEVGHNWFYGILASNERDHPYMDEGINSFYEHRYMDSFYGNSSIALPKIVNNILQGWDPEELLSIGLTRDKLNQYPNQHSANFSPINYGLDVYSRASKIMAFAEAYFGRKKFDQIMQTYYGKWAFRHPYPEDLKQVFNTYSGEDCSWLFDEMLSSDRSVDYKILSSTKYTDHVKVKIKNHKFGVASPFKLAGIHADTIVSETWITGFHGTKDVEIPNEMYDKIVIDPFNESLETYRGNNSLYLNKLIKSFDPIDFAVIPLFDYPYTNNFGVFPILGYNSNNGFMLGATASSPFFPAPKFRWYVAPMYAFKSKSLAGQLDANYNIYFTESRLRKLKLGVEMKRYAYTEIPLNKQSLEYTKINPYALIEFKHTIASGKISSVKLQTNYLEDQLWTSDSTDTKTSAYWIPNIQYKYSNPHILNPIDIGAELQYQSYEKQHDTKQSLRLALESTLQFRLNNKNYFKVRGFVGGFLIHPDRDTRSISTRRYAANSAASLGLAYQSYLDHSSSDIFIGRLEGVDNVLSNQVYNKQGGFKLNFGEAQRSNLGNSNSFIAALNLSTDLPFKSKLSKIIRPYVDLGYAHQPSKSIGNNADDLSFLVSGGVNISAMGIVDVYFPIFHSKNIQDLYNSNDQHYLQQVSFSFSIQQFNSLQKILNKISFK